MKVASFEAVVRTLNEAGVPFIVVGGIAVISHGYGRSTRDVDLVIPLQPEVIEKAFAALQGLGYNPRVPITATQFADEEQRAEWIRDKGMEVLNFHSDNHGDTPLDLFVSEPFDFDEEYRRARIEQTTPGLPLRIVRLETLLRMKARAGRSQDLADIDELNLIHGRKSNYGE